MKSARICSFSGPYFLAFGLNTERYGVFSPNTGKYAPEKFQVRTLFTRGKVKHELRVVSYEFRCTSYKFKSTKYQFKLTSYEFKSPFYEFNFMSYRFKSMSYDFKSTS